MSNPNADEEFDDFEVQAFLKDDIEKILGSNLRESFEMSLKNDFTEYQKLSSQNQQQAAQYQTHFAQEPQTPSSLGNAPGTPHSTLTPSSTPATPFSAPPTPQQQTPKQLSTPPVQNPQPATPSQQLLNDLFKLKLEQKDKIDKSMKLQKQLMANPQQEPFNSLSNEHRAMKESIEAELKVLQQLYEQVFLEPYELLQYFTLKQDLEIQHKQVDLFQTELQHLVQPSNSNVLAALVILKQPFPTVITKGKQCTDDQLQVLLLTASNVVVQSLSPVKAAMLMDATFPKGTNQKMIDCDIANLDVNTRISKFPLKFLSGTKKAPAQIRFGMQIHFAGQAAPVTVESNSSAPLVVITNECQWEGSAGTLLKKEAFAHGQLEITWPKFANTLQHHFLRATRQELSRPKRILSPFDMQYIHYKFFDGRNMVNHTEFDAFWDWFGKSMQKLRYQRHIGSLWQNGLIYGFMGRDDVNAALTAQDPGTFIIRFSESQYGQFAIAYAGTDHHNKIKHYLVQPNDTSAKKTFPDFLLECPQFATLLVLNYDVNGKATFVRTPKDQALEPYCGKKQNMMMDNGYDPL